MTEPKQQVPRTGVALSGGGHRASLFALGALLYLVDAGKAPQFVALSSCSGGSLTNAYAGLADVRTETPDEFRQRMRPLARACATTGTLYAGGLTFAYVCLLLLLAVGGLVGAYQVGGLWAPVIVVVTLLLVGFLLMKRGWLAEAAFDKTLYHKAALDALSTGVDHVLCATDLQTAEHVYFSGAWVKSYRLGTGRTTGVSLARAVASSAAFPGGFYPRRLSIKQMGFEHPEVIPSMLLTDGGVYDNMGTEWFTGGSGVDAASRRVDELVVVNGSAGQPISKRSLLSIPIVGEFAELMAVLMTTYDQTTAVRRRWLHNRFNTDQQNGAIVQIERPATMLPTQFAQYTDAKGERARAALQALEAAGTADMWAADAQASAAIRTDLSALGAETSARLIRHAYALTMANTHVLLGYPLLPIPELADLKGWVQ